MARRRSKQPDTAPEKKDERKIHYPPVANGIDYLSDVVERLSRTTQEPSDRDLKYAVLHLQAAVEVLLKSHLHDEHWTLVVAPTYKAKRDQFLLGNFDSASHHEVIRRLVEVVGIDISDSDKSALLELAKTRNKLQHWGLTDTANSVLTGSATVLDFLVRFIDQHLDIDDEAEQDMANIREGLLSAQSYIDSRMARLREGVLKGREKLTVRCPDCRQEALIVDGVDNQCHFCPRSWTDPSDLASRYDSEFVPGHAPGDPYEETLIECPDCEDLFAPATLCLQTETAATKVPVALCFACATIVNDLDECTRCGGAFRPIDEELICGDCATHLFQSSP